MTDFVVNTLSIDVFVTEMDTEPRASRKAGYFLPYAPNALLSRILFFLLNSFFVIDFDKGYPTVLPSLRRTYSPTIYTPLAL